MKKSNEKKRKLISTNQVIIYVVWFIVLFVVTMYFSAKRNEYFQEINNKVQNIVSKYGYIKEENISDKNDLHYRVGDDSDIWINLEYDENGYTIKQCQFTYNSYEDSSYKVDYYYDVIDSILPNINIYNYKEQIDYAINNRLYEENGPYMIKLDTRNGNRCFIFIHDNISNYFEYNYDIEIEFHS